MDQDILIILWGNKNDLEEMREVSFGEGLDKANENNALFFETSAKYGTSIDEMCELIAQKLVWKYPERIRFPTKSLNSEDFQVDFRHSKNKSKWW